MKKDSHGKYSKKPGATRVREIIVCEYCPEHLKHRNKSEMVPTKLDGKRICKECYNIYCNGSRSSWEERLEGIGT